MPTRRRHRAGLSRGYEPIRAQRRLATASLLELVDSPALREWSDFRQVDSMHVSTDGAALSAAAAELAVQVPGSVDLLSAADLADRGWSEIPDGQVALLERVAGYLSPQRLRDSVGRPCPPGQRTDGG